MSNTIHNLLMTAASGRDQLMISPGYHFMSVINNTDHTVTVYQEKRTADEPQYALIRVPPYTQQTIPIQEYRRDFTFFYGGGAATAKKAEIIFSAENLQINGTLGTAISGTVAIGSDATGILKVSDLNIDGTKDLQVDVKTLPALPTGANTIGTVNMGTTRVYGAHANAWNNASVGANGTSTSVDIQYADNVTAFGNASAATTITLQVSQDNVNWYDSQVNQVLSGAGNFCLNSIIGARYVRLKSSAAATITATIAAKD